MNRAIKGMLALTFAIVIIFSFHAQPAHAQDICPVSSTNPCVTKITKIGAPYKLSINPQKELLVVYTNDSFDDNVTVTLQAANKDIDKISVIPNTIRWKCYKFNQLEDIKESEASTVKIQFIALKSDNPVPVRCIDHEECINTVVVAVQADIQAK